MQFGQSREEGSKSPQKGAMHKLSSFQKYFQKKKNVLQRTSLKNRKAILQMYLKKQLEKNKCLSNRNNYSMRDSHPANANA